MSEKSGIVGIGVVGIMVVGWREEMPEPRGPWFIEGRGVLWALPGDWSEEPEVWFVDARGAMWDAGKENRGRVFIAEPRAVTWKVDPSTSS